MYRICQHIKNIIIPNNICRLISKPAPAPVSLTSSQTFATHQCGNEQKSKFINLRSGCTGRINAMHYHTNVPIPQHLSASLMYHHKQDSRSVILLPHRTICASQVNYRKRGPAPHLRKPKKKKKNLQKDDDDDDEYYETDDSPTFDEREEEEEEEVGEEQDQDDAGKEISYKDITINTSSARVDNVLGHAGFSGMSRNKVEDLFYAGCIRVNNIILEKKSKQLSKGDVCDLVRDVDPDDKSLMKVLRIKVLHVEETNNDKVQLQVRRYKGLSVRYNSESS